MQCHYCSKEAYVTYICPYCKEYFCLEHKDPTAHNCPAHQQIHLPPQKPKPEKIEKPSALTTKLLKTLFTFTFTLVLIEEILRLISYLKYSPFFPESNIYVVILSQFITPYIASPTLFIITCITLFLTKKLSEKAQSQNETVSLIAKAAPIGIYTAIAIIYLHSIYNWIFILAP
ncbi:MAG: AN1-type zinc finger domain-containing protein [Candidatus Bathyarchaeales archaeon]